MLKTFSKLLNKSLTEQESVIGDPYSVIPIKNKKCARETVEVFLGGKKLKDLQNFQDFPNLEILWLNDNKLDTNFRIKHLYLQNNQLASLKGSIEYMNHLETLLLYNNDLRGLDETLEFLKQFTYLQQLDLFGNPLAEEPNYRLKVIYALPQLQVFDRHIQLEERMKAQHMMEETDKSAKDKKKRFFI